VGIFAYKARKEEKLGQLKTTRKSRKPKIPKPTRKTRIPKNQK